jgi:hypothetical protein
MSGSGGFGAGAGAGAATGILARAASSLACCAALFAMTSEPAAAYRSTNVTG